MNLQSQHGNKQSENTDESATLTSTDDANEDAAKQSADPSEKAVHVRFDCVKFMSIKVTNLI